MFEFIRKLARIGARLPFIHYLVPGDVEIATKPALVDADVFPSPGPSVEESDVTVQPTSTTTPTEPVTSPTTNSPAEGNCSTSEASPIPVPQVLLTDAPEVPAAAAPAPPQEQPAPEKSVESAFGGFDQLFKEDHSDQKSRAEIMGAFLPDLQLYELLLEARALEVMVREYITQRNQAQNPQAVETPAATSALAKAAMMYAEGESVA